MKWAIIDTGVASPERNMTHDSELLNQLSSIENPILHFYDWTGDCATYGYFIEPYDFLSLEGVQRRGLNLARRPTGGGIVFHLCDLAFSMLVPSGHPGYSINTLDSYAFVNRIVADAVKRFMGGREQPILLPKEEASLDASSRHFCMAKPTKYDVMLEGRKVGGGAQRRTRKGFLHQGTISLAMPPEDYLKEVLRSDSLVVDSMKQNSYLLLGQEWTPSNLFEARKELRSLLVDEVQRPNK